MMKLLIPLLVLTTLSTFNGAALGSGNVYRWIGEDGNYHFGARPPKNTEAEIIKSTYTKPSNPEPKQDNQNADQSADESGKTEREYAKQLKKLEDKQKEYCEKAKANKESLLNKHKVMLMDSSGKARVLSYEEKLEKLKQTDQKISEYCGKK